MRRSRIDSQVALWRTELPYVRPMYAVKANNDPKIISWLHEAGCGFDCASDPEIAMVRKAVDLDVRRDLIYANPCKSESAIRASMDAGVALTTVDDPLEVEKLASLGYRGAVLIRLRVDDKASKMPFGRKFGCPVTYIAPVLAAARTRGITVSGVSFHVGSEAAMGSQYGNSLRDAAVAFSEIRKYGFNPEIVDIGGGFPGTDTDKFKEHAGAIREARDLFPATTQWKAEPGRFFAKSTTDLYVRVIGERPAYDRPGMRVYMLNESLYGQFSNIMYDYQKPTFEPVRVEGDKLVPIEGQAGSTDLFGHSCDSLDELAKGIQLPPLRRGDYLRIRNMGAYTSVSASEFNGFKKPEMVYLV